MNSHVRISSHRVARSWLLKKLLGPEKPRTPSHGSQSRKAPVLTPRQRKQALEGSYKVLKSDLKRAIKSEFASLNAAEKRVAKRHGIDPLFLNWYVVAGRRNWPTMSTRVRDSLRAMQSARMWFAEVPSSWQRMTVPSMDEARSRDAALVELGEWFLKNFVAKVERKFTNAVWAQSRHILDALKAPEKGLRQEASVFLLRDFKKRLGEDRFQEKPAVRRVLALFQ